MAQGCHGDLAPTAGWRRATCGRIGTPTSKGTTAVASSGDYGFTSAAVPAAYARSSRSAGRRSTRRLARRAAGTRTSGAAAGAGVRHTSPRARGRRTPTARCARSLMCRRSPTRPPASRSMTPPQPLRPAPGWVGRWHQRVRADHRGPDRSGGQWRNLFVGPGLSHAERVLRRRRRPQWPVRRGLPVQRPWLLTHPPAWVHPRASAGSETPPQTPVRTLSGPGFPRAPTPGFGRASAGFGLVRGNGLGRRRVRACPCPAAQRWRGSWACAEAGIRGASRSRRANRDCTGAPAAPTV